MAVCNFTSSILPAESYNATGIFYILYTILIELRISKSFLLKEMKVAFVLLWLQKMTLSYRSFILQDLCFSFDQLGVCDYYIWCCEPQLTALYTYVKSSLACHTHLLTVKIVSVKRVWTPSPLQSDPHMGQFYVITIRLSCSKIMAELLITHVMPFWMCSLFWLSLCLLDTWQFILCPLVLTMKIQVKLMDTKLISLYV